MIKSDNNNNGCIDFKIEITTNLTKVNFLDVNYRPYRKPNNNLTYINTSSNHPSQIIKHLTQPSFSQR